VTVVEGDLTQRRCVVVYSRSGRTTAALLVGSPHRLRAYREAVGSGALVADARPSPGDPTLSNAS
jgi:hypothetical protein